MTIRYACVSIDPPVWQVFDTDGTGRIVAAAFSQEDAERIAHAFDPPVNSCCPEPDPWPTADIVVAEGKVWHLDTTDEDRDYFDAEGNVRQKGGLYSERFVGLVVDVTVVASAEYRAAWAALDQWRLTWDPADAAAVAVCFSTLAVETDALGLDR